MEKALGINTLRTFSTILFFRKDPNVPRIVGAALREGGDVVEFEVFLSDSLTSVGRISVEFLIELCPRQAFASCGDMTGSFLLAQGDEDKESKDQPPKRLVVHSIPRVRIWRRFSAGGYE